MKLIDITGQKFGRLTVLCKGPARPGKLGGSNWKCRCECGNECIAVGSTLRCGDVRSCGCLAREWAKILGSNPVFVAKRAEKRVTHGQKRKNGMTKDYHTWLAIKSRCSCPTDGDFAAYGAKGIRVAEVWQSSFERFMADMGPRPTRSHTIDREDPAGDYAPGNCRWATPLQQVTENHRGLVPITVNGVAFPTFTAACRHFGLRMTTIRNRIDQGIPIDEAFAGPGRMKSRRTKESYLRKDRR